MRLLGPESGGTADGISSVLAPEALFSEALFSQTPDPEALLPEREADSRAPSIRSSSEDSSNPPRPTLGLPAEAEDGGGAITIAGADSRIGAAASTSPGIRACALRPSES